MTHGVMVAVVGWLVVWTGTTAADQGSAGVLLQSTKIGGRADRLVITHSVRRTDGALPQATNRLKFEFPRGSRLHHGAFPRCDLAELQARGPSACARGSEVGSGSAVGEVPVPVRHRVGASVRLFNGYLEESKRRTIYMYLRPDVGPTFVIVGRWAGNSRSGLKLDLSVPTIRIPEAPPDPAMTRFRLRLGASRGGTSFLHATCPATYNATAYYADGSVVTSSDHARCD